LSVVVGIGIVLVVIIIVVLLSRVSLFSLIFFFFFENVFEVALFYKRGNTQRVVVSLNKVLKGTTTREQIKRDLTTKTPSTPHHQLFHVFHVILASFNPTFPRVILVLFAHVRVELEV